MVVQHRFPPLLRKLDPETSISTPAPPASFIAVRSIPIPRNLYPHARIPYPHPPGIFIHIAPESLSTCPGIRNENKILVSGRIMNNASMARRSVAFPENASHKRRRLGLHGSVGCCHPVEGAKVVDDFAPSFERIADNQPGDKRGDLVEACVQLGQAFDVESSSLHLGNGVFRP